MNIANFFDYLLGRDATRDLAPQLVSVYQVRAPRGGAPRAERRG